MVAAVFGGTGRAGARDPTLADSILDRLVHNSHRIEMRGDSMRKNRGKPHVQSSQEVW
jgi:DNA replication protein DnaC